jgi:hypothetical protein
MTPRLPANLTKAFLTALLTLTAVAQPSRAAEPPYGQRTDAFRRLLFEFKLQPLDDFALLQDNPAETILIVLGDPSCLSNDRFPAGLRSFVWRGGAVLIATDKEVAGEAATNLKELAGVAVTGETLVCHNDDARIYDKNAYCPFVEPIEDANPLIRSTNVLGALATVLGAGGRPDLFRNPHPDQPALRVATNAPSRLIVPGWWGLPGGIHELARLPVGTIDYELSIRSLKTITLANGDNTAKMEPIEPPLFAVGGTLGEGRVLVLADHSIFINRMILFRDNGNLEFTANCLHWLRGGVASPGEAMKAMHGPQSLQQFTGQRNKALFWDDGLIQRNFEVPMRTRPINPSLVSQPAIVAAVDQTLANMEDRNAFNGHLIYGLDEAGWPIERLERTALFLFTFMVFLLLGYRFVWRGRHRLEATVPLLDDAVALHEPTTPLLEQRRRAMLRSGSVWETAHRLARQWFESAGIPPSAPFMPRIEAKGGWWHRRRLRRRVAHLWDLARGVAPARVRPTALKYWLRELEELKTALANGTIRLQMDEG